MQGAISAGDRKLLWTGGAIGLAMLLGTILLAPAPDEQSGAIPSSYSSTSGGTLAAFTLLHEVQVPVMRWEQAPSALPDDPTGAVLILADPSQPPSKGERKGLLHFVEGGGRIIFCGGEITKFFPGPGITRTPFTREWTEFPSTLPSGVTRGAPAIMIQPTAHWAELNPAQLALYGDTQTPVVVSWRLGAGEILWWASATPLTNAGISRGNNLRFFLNSVGGATNVYWDEYFHGQRGSLWGYVERTSIYWAVAQLLLMALVVAFTFSRRSGPISIPAPLSRLSPIEFVDTMGGLYQRAGAAAVPVEIAYRQLRLRLARRLGLMSSVTDEDLARTASERLGFRAEELFATLRTAASMRGNAKVRGAAALNLVRELEDYQARLEHPKYLQEKI